jgi:hypothetical protein
MDAMPAGVVVIRLSPLVHMIDVRVFSALDQTMKLKLVTGLCDRLNGLQRSLNRDQQATLRV